MKTLGIYLLGLIMVAIFCLCIIRPVNAQAYNNNNYYYYYYYYGLTDNFKIRRIDLYDSMYIIYAQRGDSIFKIYSRQEMERPQGGEVLRVDSTYRLSLYPLFSIGILRSSLILYRGFRGRDIRYEYTPADYCVKNLFMANNIFDKCVYSEIPNINKTYRHSNLPNYRAPKKRLPKNIEKIRRGNAANPKK